MLAEGGEGGLQVLTDGLRLRGDLIEGDLAGDDCLELRFRALFLLTIALPLTMSESLQLGIRGFLITFP